MCRFSLLDKTECNFTIHAPYILKIDIIQSLFCTRFCCGVLTHLLRCTVLIKST